MYLAFEIDMYVCVCLPQRQLITFMWYQSCIHASIEASERNHRLGLGTHYRETVKDLILLETGIPLKDICLQDALLPLVTIPSLHVMSSLYKKIFETMVFLVDPYY